MEALTREELRLAAVGSMKEQQCYIIGVLDRRYYLSDKVWPVIGRVLKTYSFESVLSAAKTVVGLDDENFFAVMNYACGAYEETLKAEKSVEEQRGFAQVVETLRNSRNSAKRLKKARQDPDTILTRWLFSDVITQEEYERVKNGQVDFEEMVKEVDARGGTS